MALLNRGHAAPPTHPQLAPWAQWAVDGERVLLRDGDAAVVLEGAAAGRLLPSLLPLLDGTRTGDELAASFGEAVAPGVRHALGVLAAQGLLVEGPLPAGAPAAVAPAVLGAAAGLAGGSPAEVGRALAGRTVAVAGNGSVAALVAALLGASGPQALRVGGGEAAGADLVIVAPDRAGRDSLAAWDERLREAGQPWLAVPGLDGRRALVGPLVVPGASACWECVRQRRAAASGFGDAWAALDAAPGPDLEGAAAALAAAVAVQVALCALVDGVGVAVPAGVVWAVELVPEPAIARHVVHRVPRCPACAAGLAHTQRLPWQAEGAA